MEFIQNLFSGESIIVVVVGFIIGMLAKRKPGMVGKAKSMTDDLSAWMGDIHDAIKDGKISKSEAMKLGAPAVDTFEKIKELVKKKK